MKEILVVDPKANFSEAFSLARRLGFKEFEWRDDRYHTMTEEEVRKKSISSLQEIIKGIKTESNRNF